MHQEEKDAHRREKTDPYAANAALIVRAVNNHDALIAGRLAVHDAAEMRDYLWPCILAFVRSWATEDAFAPGGRYDPALIVPNHAAGSSRLLS